MNETIWAVCLYAVGGDTDGESIIEFVRAKNRGDAEAQAINLNGHNEWELIAAAKMPYDV